MLAQSATSRANEKVIIADFNSKLAERISAFKTNRSWVSLGQLLAISLLAENCGLVSGSGIPTPLLRRF
jgi:hypothetical protein